MTVIPDRSLAAGRLLRAKLPAVPAWPASAPKVQWVAKPGPPDWRKVVLSYALTLGSLILIVILFNLTVVSQLQHWNSQRDLYAGLRLSLAEGSVPIGQVDIHGDLVADGTPVALLEIPRIGLREVIVEGTSSRDTKLGVGHRRDTPLPGQAGVSVLMGRASAYGGPFRDLALLQRGDTFSVTTGQGVAQYEVLGPRLGTVELPAMSTTDGRLTLTTASGRSFQPTGVLRVDAQLVSKSNPRPPVAIAPGVLAPQDEAMASDTSRAFSLSWLAELLVALALAAVWSWKRWKHAATWIVFVPAITMTALACSDRVTDLLPNLL